MDAMTTASAPPRAGQAVAALAEDHALIRRMLAVLDALAAALRRIGPFPNDDVAALLRCFREFVDHGHQPFEAEILYPVVLAQGSTGDAALAGRLVADHEETRELLHALELLWEPRGELTTEERESFADVAHLFAVRLRRHLREEETRLFPLLAQQPDRAVHETRASVRRRYRRVVRELARRWLACDDA
jgi:hemerythrin-like domain-containing protein